MNLQIVFVYLAAFLAFALVLWIGLTSADNDKKQGKRIFSSFIKKGRNEKRILRLSQYLKSKGANYHIGIFADPYMFIVLSVMSSGIIFAAMNRMGSLPAILFGIMGLFLPVILVELEDKADNSKMLRDIKLIYNALFIRIKAGVYCIDALCECESLVKSKRLANALRSLAASAVMKTDIYSALENMKLSFDSVFIDSLVITIMQSLQSGKSLEMIEDLGEQIKNMEQIMAERQESSVERKQTLMQLFILSAVMGIVISATVSDMLLQGTFI